jgi:hypothetical protein
MRNTRTSFRAFRPSVLPRSIVRENLKIPLHQNAAYDQSRQCGDYVTQKIKDGKFPVLVSCLAID